MHPSAVLITVGTKQNKRPQVTAIHQISYESNWNRSHNYTWHKEYESLEPGNFPKSKITRRNLPFSCLRGVPEWKGVWVCYLSDNLTWIHKLGWAILKHDASPPQYLFVKLHSRDIKWCRKLPIFKVKYWPTVSCINVNLRRGLWWISFSELTATDRQFN